MSGLPFMPLGQAPNLFAGAGAPPYVNQFDLSGILGNNPLSMMASMAIGSFFGPSMASNGFMAGMFSPNMNFYDVQRSMAYHNGMLSAMAQAQSADSANLINMARGLMGGLTASQEAAVSTFANDAGMFMPMLAQVAPGLVDTLYGSRGSSVLMAQELYQGSRLRSGVSPENAGALATVMGQEFFGPTANISGWKGLSQHKVGSLYNVLATQQMLGTANLGAMTASQQLEQLTALPNAGASFNLAQDFTRLASGNELEQRRYRDIVARSGVNVSGMSTEQQAQALAQNDTAVRDVMRDIQQFDSGRYDQIVNQFDAKQVANRLKSLAGAVSAMRDIFGDAGRPNAPMSELINGLNQLTQGGLASMSPAELERSVRLTQALAQNTGIGIQGMQQLVAIGASTADQLGLDRGFALSSAQGAAAFGAAYGAVGRPDSPAYGRLDAEKYTMMDQQLRMRAAASPIANRMNLVLRMEQEVGFEQGSQAQAMADAIRAGKDTYTFNGQQHSVVLSGPGADAQLYGILGGRGITQSTIQGMLNDNYTNQQYGLQANTGDIARRAMMERDLKPLIGQQFGTAALAATAGLNLSPEQAKRVRDAVGAAASNALSSMSAEEYTNTETRNKLLQQAIRESLPAGVQLSDQAIAGIAAGGWGNWESSIRNNPALRHLQSGVASLDLMNQSVLGHQGTVVSQAQHDANMRSAFAGLGTSNFAKRISNYLQGAGADPDKPGDVKAFINQLLGGVPDEAVAARLTTAVEGAAVLMDESKKLSKERQSALDAVKEAKANLAKAKESGDKSAIAAAQENVKTAEGRLRAAESGLQDITSELGSLMGSDEKLEQRIKILQSQRADMEAAGQDTTAIDKRIAALQTGGVAANAEQAGVLTKVTVSAQGSFEAAAAIGSGRKGSFAKQQSLLDSFFGNEQNVMQLGTGGLALLDKAKTTSDALQKLADSKKMTVDELIASGDPEAMKLVQEQRTTLEQIATRQRENSTKPPMSKEEEEEVKRRVGQYKRPDMYAQDVVSSLEKQIGATLTGEERAELVRNIASGGVQFVDRIQRAAKAREKLAGNEADIAAHTKDGKVSDYIAQLQKFKTAEEAEQAGYNAEHWKLAQEAGDVGLLGESAAGSAAMGNSGSAIGDAVSGLREKEKKEKNEMTLTGRVEIVDKRNADVAFRGRTQGNTPALEGMA